MKINIKTITLSEIVIDTEEWTSTIFNETKKFDVPKFDIKTVNDLALLISKHRKIPRRVVYFVCNGDILPRKTQLKDNMKIYLFYKQITCKKHKCY